MRKVCAVVLLLVGIMISPVIKSQENNQTSLIQLVRSNAKQLHISATDAENMKISSSHFDAPSGITYVYLQQQYQKISVHNSIIVVAFRGNQLMYTSGKFIDNLSAKAGPVSIAVNAPQAVSKAADKLGLSARNIQTIDDRFNSEKKVTISPSGIAKRNIETEMLWYSTDDGATVQLAWNVNIDVLNSTDWWNVIINAKNGNYIDQYNWTVHEHTNNSEANCVRADNSFKFPIEQYDAGQKQMSPPNVTSATYKVIPFPKESPSHSAPTNVTNPWELAGAGNNATTHGWHFDGTNNYDITRGNNAFAYLDVTASNSPDATSNWPDTSTTTAPALTFVSTPDFFTSPRAIPNKKFALDNLFYWNNLMHDVSYQYGFTEAAGNFQKDNLGRGGAGNDWVNAQAQDGAGTDNANFSVPGDGGNGRMRMYLFNGPSFLKVTAPSSIAGNYVAYEGNFSTANLLKNIGPKTGQVVYFNDATGAHEACGVGAAPVNSITGKIALIDRGTCNFTEKVKNAETAGAIAVIVVNNVAGDPLIMGGADNTITIPSVMITQADGAILAAQLSNGLTVTLSDGGRDGDLDNGIVTHEYGHGISIRLTGGPANSSCLTNAEQGGEGWSDYFALMMTTNWATATVNDGGNLRPVGTYAASQATTGAGIRRFPYTTNMGINTLTYSNLASSPEVHDIGEIWCSAIWDMTWNIIQQTNSITPNLYNAGGNGGNVIAMNLVMMGLKLQPCNPGFLDSRNAILAADSILYNNAHKCVIWNAFARRGMGASAVQGSSTSATDQTVAFDLPSGLSLARTTPLTVNTGSSFAVSTAATCACQPLTGYVIRDTIPAGFSVVSSSPAGTLNGNVFSFNAANWTAMEAKNFNLTLQANSAGCVVDSVINDNRDGQTIGGFTSTTTGAGGGWAASTLRAHTGTNSWLATEPATVSTSNLASANTVNSAGQNMTVLSFWHYYNTESKFDGGVVEYSFDGTNWSDAEIFFIKNGYNATMDATTVLSGRKAFSGNSGSFIQSIIDFSSLGMAPSFVRFRMTSDDGTAGEGWFIDDIIRSNGCGGTVKTGAYSNTGVRIDTTMTPVFVKNVPSSITINSQPVNLTICAGQNASFTVAASSATALNYQWQVSTNGGGSFANINGETGAVLTLNAVTASLNGTQYKCIITDATSTVNSSVVTLTVNTNPVVTAQPANKTVCVGVNASFAVTATGAVSYQWQVSTDGGANYTNVSGATTSSLSFATTLAQNGNKYRCAITNTCGTVQSNEVTLTVSNAAITSSPISTSQCAGTNAVFTVVTSGTGLSYQWQVSTDAGASFSNINGATAATLILSGITAAQNATQYRCVVTAGCGVLTSSAATLSVTSVAITIASLPTRICESDPEITLSATPAGGAWTGTSVTNGKFVPAVAKAGQHTLTYTLTSGPGCVYTNNIIATVEDCIDRNLSFANNGILLYPNPNDGEFFIKLNSLLYNEFTMDVYNSTGQHVKHQEYKNLQYGSVTTVNLKYLSSGVYHVKVHTIKNGVLDEKTFTILIRR